MSSFRKAAPRRTHKERSQLGARTHMGLLEKKKDYKIRSADYHRKENAIKALKVKAEFRNPDEFYHKMISSSTKKGVHEVKQRVEKYDGDALKLLKSADLRYLNLVKTINTSKLNKACGISATSSEITHVVFDGESMLSRKVKPSPISLSAVPVPISTQKVTGADIESVAGAKVAHEKLSQSRVKRQKTLEIACRELEIQRFLGMKGQGGKKIAGVDSNGLKIFKWKGIRAK